MLIGIYHPFWKNESKHDEAIACILDVIVYVANLSLFDETQLNVIVCGDFNDLICRSTEFENVTGLKKIVDTATRGNRILDQIFTDINCDAPPKISTPFGRSDHAVVTWFPRGVRVCSVKKRVRNFCNANRYSFQRVLSLIDWSLIDSFDDPDFALLVFQNVLYFVFDSCFPRTTVRFNGYEPPWMSMSLKILMNCRDRAYSKGQLDKYCHFRSTVVILTGILKRRYLTRMQKACNQRDAWKSIRSLSRNCKTEVSSDFSAELLNSYFSSVFEPPSAIDTALADCDLSSVPVHFLQVDVIQIVMYLRKLKKGTGGPTCLPYWVFKDNSVFLAQSIVSIFNRFFRLGRFPYLFKFADVIPIPKVSKPTDVSHSRPISSLPVLSKILEKIVLH